MSGNDLWLDTDRSDGTTSVRLTAERIREAHEYRLLHGAVPRPVLALNILSHRHFEVTGLRYTERDPNCYGSLQVVRGCFVVLEVPLATLGEGDDPEAMGTHTPWSWPVMPYRGIWPTRLWNPARQNLSFLFRGGSLAPVAIEVHWQHWKQVELADHEGT